MRISNLLPDAVQTTELKTRGKAVDGRSGRARVRASVGTVIETACRSALWGDNNYAPMYADQVQVAVSRGQRPCRHRDRGAIVSSPVREA
jgi:hypothetical protein